MARRSGPSDETASPEKIEQPTIEAQDVRDYVCWLERHPEWDFRERAPGNVHAAPAMPMAESSHPEVQLTSGRTCGHRPEAVPVEEPRSGSTGDRRAGNGGSPERGRGIPVSRHGLRSPQHGRPWLPLAKGPKSGSNPGPRVMPRPEKADRVARIPTNHRKTSKLTTSQLPRGSRNSCG